MVHLNLNIKELKTIINEIKQKKSKKKRFNKKKNRLTNKYNIGGIKSDSSQMQGYSNQVAQQLSIPNAELFHVQRQLIENKINEADRFSKQPPQQNLLTNEGLDNYMQQKLQPAFRQISNTLQNHNDLINRGSDALQYLVREAVPADKVSTIYDVSDTIDTTTTQGSDQWQNKEGNTGFVQESDNYIGGIEKMPSQEPIQLFTSPDTNKAQTPSTNTPMSDYKPRQRPKFYNNLPNESFPKKLNDGQDRLNELHNLIIKYNIPDTGYENYKISTNHVDNRNEYRRLFEILKRDKNLKNIKPSTEATPYQKSSTNKADNIEENFEYIQPRKLKKKPIETPKTRFIVNTSPRTDK